MTQSTEQERAEFEKWWSSPHIWGRGHKEAQWASWQAARRAPAAPVPQGWKLVPVEPTEEMLRSMAGQFFGTMPEAKAAFDEALAAAPQPPEATVKDSLTVEAAPVQMPEAQAEVEVRSMKTYLDLSIHEWSDTLPDGCYKIYTEHQVRQLLAAQGIQEQST